MEQITFVDAQQMAIDHPETFNVPTGEELANLEVNDFVKINPGNERFWVKLTHIDFVNQKLKGAVANELLNYNWEYGTELEFEMKNIYDIIKNTD